MKKILLPTLLLVSFVLSAQKTTIRDIITFNTIEKNKKTVIFSKKSTSYNINYMLSAKNKASKDFSNCKWISYLTKKELKGVAVMLAKIKQGEVIKTNLLTLKAKNNRVDICFNDTRCTSEHKTHYFQKSCKRELSFIVRQDQIKELSNVLTKEIEQDVLVNQ